MPTTKTSEEIIKGIELRLSRLNETLEIISLIPDKLTHVKDDTESKIDELESLLEWIKNK